MKSPTASDIAWKNNFAEAKAFYKEHGRFPTYSDNRKLRQWASKIEKGETLSCRKKLQQLLAIGYELSDKWKLWNHNYSQAKAIYQETGAAPTYSNGKECRRYFDLWIINSGRLHPDRVSMLAEIGFAVSSEDKNWHKNYEAAQAHFNKTGRFPNSQENIILFMWARTWMKRHGDTHPEQAALLRQIGFNPE